MLMRNLEKDDVRAVSHQTQTGQPAGSSIFVRIQDKLNYSTLNQKPKTSS